MKKFFCRTQMILILLILILGISTSVYADASKVAVGDKYKFNGQGWYVYKTAAAAEDLDSDYFTRYIKNGETITVKEKKGNVLKIANNEFIYYGSTAAEYFKKATTISKNTDVSSLENPDVVTDKDNIIRVRYSAKDVVNNKTTKNGSDKNVCLYYAKRMMGNSEIKLNNEKSSISLSRTIINEINKGRPILIKAKRRNANNEEWRFVLIYAYNNSTKVNNRSKFYIIDPLTGKYSNLIYYDIVISKKYEYITINGEHSNELKKQQLENNNTTNNNGISNNSTINNNIIAGTQAGNKYTARNKKVFTLYKQTDYNQRYWTNTIATDGCGPSSCAIIASGYGSKDTPATIVNNNGCWYGGIAPMVDYLESKGLDVFVTYNGSASNSYILNKLEEGYKLIVNVQDGYVGNKYYWGHYYTILDVQKGTSKVFVGEPYTPKNGWYDISDLTGKEHIIFAK